MMSWKLEAAHIGIKAPLEVEPALANLLVGVSRRRALRLVQPQPPCVVDADVRFLARNAPERAGAERGAERGAEARRGRERVGRVHLVRGEREVVRERDGYCRWVLEYWRWGFNCVAC